MGINTGHITPWHNDKLQPKFGISHSWFSKNNTNQAKCHRNLKH
jgi:hypothetical protein